MSTRILLVIIGLILAGIALAIWSLQPAVIDGRPLEHENGPAEGKSQTLNELVHRLNTGVAHLENDQLDDAATDFTILAEELPDEPAPPRNLMVTRVLQVQKLEPSSPQRSTAIEQAR